MVEYSYEIFRLYTAPSKDGLTNVVTGANWRYQIQEDSHYADIYLVTNFSDPDSENFTQFEGLTDETVFSWIEDNENLEQIQLDLQEKLEKVKNPDVIEKLVPWTSEKTSKYTGEEDYLLVFDDEPEDPLKIWGPMKWNSKIANNGLKSRGVKDYTFPEDIIMYQKELLPETNSVVNERTKIYRVEYTEQPELNPIFQYHEGLSWVTTSGKAVGTYFVIDRTLEDAKKEFIQQIEQKSSEDQNSGVDIVIQDKTINARTDLGTRLSLTQQWLLADEDANIKCKLNLTDWITVTKSELKTIINQLNAHVQTFLDQECEIVEQVNECVNIDELKDVVNNNSIGSE
jgi:hypothetical protein